MAHSEWGCEKCGLCFVALEKLDRHRLRCLPADAGVLVRSSKAFSGYEGVVASQAKDKWEVVMVNDRGYGRKRQRVGGQFDTAEEAAKAYAVACREMLDAEAEEERLESEGRDGGAGADAEGAPSPPASPPGDDGDGVMAAPAAMVVDAPAQPPAPHLRDSGQSSWSRRRLTHGPHSTPPQPTQCGQYCQ